MNKTLLLQGTLFTLIGFLAPIAAVLSASTTLSPRIIAGTAISAVIGGATALKAFLSTTYAESKPPLGEFLTTSYFAKPVPAQENIAEPNCPECGRCSGDHRPGCSKTL